MKKLINKYNISLVMLVICILVVNTFTAFCVASYISRERDADTKKQSAEGNTGETRITKEYPSDVYTFGAPDRIIVSHGEKSVTLEKGSEDYEIILLQNEYRRSQYYESYGVHEGEEQRAYFSFSDADTNGLEAFEYMAYYEAENSYQDFILVEYVFDDVYILTDDIRRCQLHDNGYTAEVNRESMCVNSIVFFIDRGRIMNSSYFIITEGTDTQLMTGTKHNSVMLGMVEDVLDINS